MTVKQVIVVRKDLNFGTKGKMIAQASHAVFKVFVDLCIKEKLSTTTATGMEAYNQYVFQYKTGDAWDLWLNGIFTKVCVYVNSEQELMDVYQKAKDVGLPTALIEDNGLTVFKGVKTKTCCAIGPGFIDEVNNITGHLKLL